MRTLEALLCRVFLSRALERACESPIPRSGEDGKRVNCFSVSIDRFGEPYFLVTALSGPRLHGLEWTGERYAIKRSIELSDIDPRDVFVAHYYGLSDISYSGILDLAIGRIFFWPYIKIHTNRFFSRVDQYFFNKKKLITKQRIDLLRFLVDRHLEGSPIRDTIDLMTALYTIKWVLHPDRDSQRLKLRFYLRSLVDTGELRESDSGYEVTGNALRAIEEYEEQERKHTESVKIQRRIMWLTLAIAFLTAVQAELLKLPTIFNLSG